MVVRVVQTVIPDDPELLRAIGRVRASLGSWLARCIPIVTRTTFRDFRVARDVYRRLRTGLQKTTAFSPS